MFIFPVQLTTSRIGNITRLIYTLLCVMTMRTSRQGSKVKAIFVQHESRPQLEETDEKHTKKNNNNNNKNLQGEKIRDLCVCVCVCAYLLNCT